MIVQILLTLGLAFCLVYAFAQRKKSRLVSLALSVIAIAAIYFVQFPESANTLAHFVGVGRGADLILYCWLVISLIVSVDLQFKILALQGMLTELTREIALQNPHGISDHSAGNVA